MLCAKDKDTVPRFHEKQMCTHQRRRSSDRPRSIPFVQVRIVVQRAPRFACHLPSPFLVYPVILPIYQKPVPLCLTSRIISLCHEHLATCPILLVTTTDEHSAATCVLSSQGQPATSTSASARASVQASSFQGAWRVPVRTPAVYEVHSWFTKCRPPQNIQLP